MSLRFLAVLSLLLAAPAGAVPLTKGEQGCVKVQNNYLSRAFAAQRKVAESCVRDAQGGKTENLGVPPQAQTAQACLQNDPRGSVARAIDAIATGTTKSCVVRLEAPPSFAYSAPQEAAETTVAEALALEADLFGDDLDAVLATTFTGSSARDVRGASCQSAVMKTAGGLARSMWKAALSTAVKAVRQQGSVPPVANAAELAGTVAFAWTANPKLDKAAGKIATAVDKICTHPKDPPIATLEALFPGCVPAAVTTAESLKACAVASTRCRVCRAFALADQLPIDCDTVDDASANGSCDAPAIGSVFVATTGDDANAGTPEAPLATVTAGIQRAVTDGRGDVRVAVGTYDESIELASGVRVRGGYDAATWVQGAAATSTLLGSNVYGVLALDLTEPAALEHFTVVMSDRLAGSSYAAIVSDSAHVRFESVELRAGDGGNGAEGELGGEGADAFDGGQGNPGCEDDGFPCGSCTMPARGSQGASACGRTGGEGGRSGIGAGSSGAGEMGGGGFEGTLGGDGAPGTSQDGEAGDPGAPGGPGNHGAGGAAFGGADASGYVQLVADSGGVGEDGQGGGGGGGGGGGDDMCESWGSSGGGGGGGGCGGGGGSGGQGGGASIALYVWNSTVSVTDSTLATGDGGSGGGGGDGGPGGEGGGGGPGGPYGGSTEQDDAGDGAPGGAGGDAGNGGAGGGGGGGPSIGIVCAGGGAIDDDSGNTFLVGTGGTGGSSFGNPGSPGLAAEREGCL